MHRFCKFMLTSYMIISAMVTCPPVRTCRVPFEVPLHKLLLTRAVCNFCSMGVKGVSPSLAKTSSIDTFVAVVAIGGHWLETCS